MLVIKVEGGSEEYDPEVLNFLKEKLKEAAKDFSGGEAVIVKFHDDRVYGAETLVEINDYSRGRLRQAELVDRLMNTLREILALTFAGQEIHCVFCPREGRYLSPALTTGAFRE